MDFKYKKTQKPKYLINFYKIKQFKTYIQGVIFHESVN